MTEAYQRYLCYRTTQVEDFISCNYEKRRTFVNPMFLYVEQYDIKFPS